MTRHRRYIILLARLGIYGAALVLLLRSLPAPPAGRLVIQAEVPVSPLVLAAVLLLSVGVVLEILATVRQCR